MYHTFIETPLGAMLAVAEYEENAKLALIQLDFMEKRVKVNAPQNSRMENTPLFDDLRLWLADYFLRKKMEMTIPLKTQGSAFQEMVWALLLKIPYGETTTYGSLAKQIAKSRGISTMSAQAVGGAVGRNPISILIPCHRVIGTDGSLTGYASGIPRKKALLELEGFLL